MSYSKKSGNRQLVHTTSNLNISKAYIETVNSAIFKFFWKEKKVEIKRRLMISDYDEGGLRGPSIDTVAISLRLKWVPRLSSEYANFEESWKAIPFIYWTNMADLGFH